MKRNRKSGSLYRKLFYYFLAFTVIFIALLWILQVFTLNYSYKSSRLNDIMKTGRQVKAEISDEDSADEIIEDLSIDRDTAIVLYDTSSGSIITSNAQVIDELRIRFNLKDLFSPLVSSPDSPEILLYMNSKGMEVSRFSIMKGKSDRSYYDADVKAIIYLTTATNEEDHLVGLMVIGSIVPVEATVSTLRRQLVMISIILLIVSLLIAMIAARNISKPISEINRQAALLARGSYDTEFNARGYREIEELSTTLDAMAEDLGKADQMQKELIANVSHDLRTPLTMISGYGELMRDIPDENNPENVQIIIDEAKRLTSLVNNLLDISKLQSGNEALSTGIINCDDMVYGVVQSYQMMEAEGYRIMVEALTENRYIEADQARIQQVLYNLMNNAINHCGDDKEVILRYQLEGDAMRFDVIDHGEGIAEDELEKIWQRYYKSDRTRHYVPGSGIGLSIVKTILDMHGAEYGVNSKLGEGSDFYFKIKVLENDEPR
ncbi:MAG: HAMP domain-containing histidine kinase [Erysipelotrichaceae bacterium]|nr:HAMP domain-containing histidine kinase [Erysipelotrichaceae bacterium]